MTWALASEPPRSDHISPIPVTRVVRGKKSSSPVSYRSPLANSCSPKSKFYFTKRTSSPLANNSSRRTIVHPIQNMLFGELKFAMGERSSRRTSSRRTLVRGGWFSSRERIFWRTVRQFAAEYGRTQANPGELRRTPANLRRTPANVRQSSAECRYWRTDGEFVRSSPNFARVRGERQFAGYTALESAMPPPALMVAFWSHFCMSHLVATTYVISSQPHGLNFEISVKFLIQDCRETLGLPLELTPIILG